MRYRVTVSSSRYDEANKPPRLLGVLNALDLAEARFLASKFTGNGCETEIEFGFYARQRLIWLHVDDLENLREAVEEALGS